MNLEDLINLDEDILLSDEKYMVFIDYILKKRQMSEEFLIKTVDWYDPCICLKYQKNLTAEFCFKYLYDNGKGYADDWVSYSDIERYLEKYKNNT